MSSTRGFFFSLLFGSLLLIGTILGVGLLMISYGIDQQTSRLTEQFQEQLLDIVQSEIQASWPHVETPRIEQYFGGYAKESRFRLTVIDIEGRILGDTEFPAEKMETHQTLERPEIIAAMNGKRGEDVRISKTMHMEYRYLAAPIFEEGKLVAAVRVAIPSTVFLENRQAVFGGVLKNFALMFLAVLLLLPILLRWIWYKPLRILNDEAHRIAEGNLEPSAIIERPFEIAQLSQSLETMRRTASGQIETITRQREGLRTILHNFPDAIFAINRSGEVTYFNDAARKLFHIETAQQHSLLQGLVRNGIIVEWYLESRKSLHLAERPASPVIERKEVDLFGSKHVLELELVAADNTTPEDASCLLIVSDLTEPIRANKMKTDFVANASHELRTPLAAIRAALDNVSGDVFDDREMLEKIIKIVDRQVSRLDALVEDLLALHGAEDETIPAQQEVTNVAEQQICIEELFRERIDEKNLTFSLVSHLGDVSFRVDNKRLGLIVQNLIDNAIKFTPLGRQITLNFRREGSFLVIECSDTGLGIAVEEQHRVFERFYQGESARTGDGRLRGTGLGLAIVKHAVERLRGSISLESRLAQGSVFTVRIPVDFMESTVL
jgi:two-component system phosphate regulon sensor histidine kinase PhoR